jgi:alpha-L-fucosidase
MTANRIDRRTFINWTCGAAVLGASGGLAAGSPAPGYLANHESLYREDPHRAALEWFRGAGFGLFVHYALASLLERGKPDYLELISGMEDSLEASKLPAGHPDRGSPGSEALDRLGQVHQELMQRFTAERFDAAAICDLAVAAGMRYVNLTTRHLGRLALWNTQTTDFNSVKAPAGRDLVAEMAQACAERNLGLFLYVPPETARTDGVFFEHNRVMLRELLQNYGPIAGIWFDGIALFTRSPQNYGRLGEQFRYIRSLQPQCLVSFKEGAIGEEDFTSPEHFHMAVPESWDTPLRQQRWESRMERWNRLYTERWASYYQSRPVEINTTMQECWGRDGVGAHGGWINDESARHLNADEVWYLLGKARHSGSNMLMNIGPRGDGSIHPEDASALREVGRRIRQKGFPGQDVS